MAEKILITGAGGYLGSITTYLFLQNGYEVVALDNFITGYREPLELLQKKFRKEKLRFYEVDLRDDLKKILDRETGIVAAVHFAASCLVDESMKNPRKYFTNNVTGSQNLLAALLEAGIDKIVFSSTAAVYGEAKNVPINEEHPTDPINPYGASKKMVEEIVQWYGKLLGLHYVIFRYFNVCGASDDGLIGDSKKPSQLLMQNAVRGALEIEPFYLVCPEVDTNDKTPIRDFVNVVDLATAHLKAVEYLLSGGQSEVINLGTGTGNSVLEIVERVQEITGVKFDVKKGESRKGDPAKLIASNKKAQQVLGWQPERSITDSINSLVKWYKTHPHGWE